METSWSFFFNQFHFTLTYRPGSKNIKPDALSRVYVNSPQEVGNTTVITSSKIIAPIRWDLESIIGKAQDQEPDPGEGPTNRLFIPKAVRSKILQWGILLNLPVILGPLILLSSFRDDFGGQPSRKMLQHLLMLAQLPTRVKALTVHPRDSCTHFLYRIDLYLPLSQGSMTILVIVDRFIPLPKLPTAKETAELVMNHVLQVFGIPQDIVSDRGPQFSSRFSIFCNQL